jgi:hypothetical protein
MTAAGDQDMQRVVTTRVFLRRTANVGGAQC